MAETSIYLDEDLKADLDEIAHERSEPGNRVSRSAIIQEAAQEFVDRHRSDENIGESDGDAGGAQATN
ncbi:ribbon-helix-helix protein, CopG family [Haloterrigena sp. SYSU A558-1]|uniref:Ribbon-helix-helix protein, CopG family n=1 Tax=Haloterrigena gelatinilytica TaxID=2741724 RepID=A0ABX2LB22_9EURY|nr:CopG family transcriptional regulator [Haloterrigena gelatinilytica]NUC71745.1 ribbon-helix-helix protein, CopG family [Haloterrigena gelatinilytica]